MAGLRPPIGTAISLQNELRHMTLMRASNAGHVDSGVPSRAVRHATTGKVTEGFLWDFQPPG
jgi:hypothetical protein